MSKLNTCEHTHPALSVFIFSSPILLHASQSSLFTLFSSTHFLPSSKHLRCLKSTQFHVSSQFTSWATSRSRQVFLCSSIFKFYIMSFQVILRFFPFSTSGFFWAPSGIRKCCQDKRSHTDGISLSESCHSPSWNAPGFCCTQVNNSLSQNWQTEVCTLSYPDRIMLSCVNSATSSLPLQLHSFPLGPEGLALRKCCPSSNSINEDIRCSTLKQNESQHLSISIHFFQQNVCHEFYF